VLGGAAFLGSQAVIPQTRTPEGQPHRCPLCGKPVVIEPSHPAGDAPCPHCGCLLWFSDIPGPEGIYAFYKLLISDCSIRTKGQAITAILDRLVEVGALEAEYRQEVLAAILKREELGSTAIGRGVAIPNATYPGVGGIIGALASFPAGVEFDRLDGEPVDLVCLLVSPTDRPGEHLRVLEAVARRLREAN